MANILYHSLQPGLEDAYLNGGAGFVSMGGPAMPGPHEEGGMIYSTSELNDPEYSTDDFRMFHFKVARCSKRYVHDWRSCPFAHPTENARRRDPRTTRYLPVPCPDYKRGICMRGDTCPYSHGVYECWLHPAKYRTQLCKEGPQCRRPVCFFAHSVGDLRQPTHLWNGSNGVQAPGSAAANLVGNQQPSQPAINTDVIKSNNVNLNMHMQAQRSQSDAANLMQVAAEEAFNNMQEQSVSVHSGSRSASLPAAQSVSPPLSPLRAGFSGEASNGAAGVTATATRELSEFQKDNEDATPRTPSLQGGDPFANQSNTTDGFVNGSRMAASSTQEDPSVAASDMTSQQSSEDNSTTLNGATIAAASAAVAAAAATAAASRISLDSNMQQRAANQAARTGAPSWSQGLAVSASAAVALAGVPVNEQPMLPNHGPRMSNAVARKLGLAPVKPPTAAPEQQQQQQQPARSARGNGNTTPGRHSIDGSVPIQQHNQPASYQQHQTGASSLDEVRLSRAAAIAAFGNGNGNGNGMGFSNATNPSQLDTGHNGNGMYSSSYPRTADPLGIHPALLNLVAANMANGNNNNNINGGGNNGNNNNNVVLQHYQQQQQQYFAFPHGGGSSSSGGGGGDPHGFPNGHGMNNSYNNGGMMNGGGMMMEDPGVASLLGHMSQWGLSDSSGDSIRGEGSVHSSSKNSFPHRGSSDGMLGVSGLPQQGPSHGGAGQASYLMSLDLAESSNNNNDMEGTSLQSGN